VRKRKTISERQAARIQAYKLASADFFYAMDPNTTADLVGMETSIASRVRTTKFYKDHICRLEMEHRRKIESKMNEDAEKLRASLSTMVPKALEVLNKSLADPEGQTALRAAQEILDRDGRMPKVSRIQTTQEQQNPLGEVDKKTIDEFKGYVQ